MGNPLVDYAPDVHAAMAAVGRARASLDLDLETPPIALFDDQFGVDVTGIDDDMRGRFLAATGPTAFEVVQVIYIDDYFPRIAAALIQIFGTSHWEQSQRGEPEPLWPLVEEFMRQVARLDHLDPVLTELVRLRGARQHQCRLCSSRRSVAAIDSGADEGTFDAVDHYAESDLPPATKAALALTDAVIWTPYTFTAELVDDLHDHLAPEQIVEVVLDVARNAANKIAVALGADAATVTEGVELFRTDADGNVVLDPPGA